MDKSISKTHCRLFMILTKYLPIFISVVYMIYYTLNIMDYNVEWIKYISKLSIASIVYFYVSSVVLKFCLCHRMFIHYIAFCNIATIYDRHLEGVDNFHTWCYVKILIGIVLLSILIYHSYRYNVRCCNK